MRVNHPIYGPGTVLRAAAGVFAYVKFDRSTGLVSHHGKDVLAVSLNVCS